MRTLTLGRTHLTVAATGFGALPIQRVTFDEAAALLNRALDGGVHYIDTARVYTDSEEKLGAALHDVRQSVVISTKSMGRDKKTVLAHIEESLRRLQTDYIDLFQFHNPPQLPDSEDPDGAFAAGRFETLQLPFSYLASQEDLALAESCRAADMGFIAMKGLAGGMLNNAAACYAYLGQFDYVVPIWGIQHEWELDQWLELTEREAGMTPELAAFIEADRKELAGDFCRSCGYCLPCAVGIDIPQAARMSALLRRSPYQPYMSDVWYEKMHRIEACIHCDACKSRCPYQLDTPALLQKMLVDYDAFYAAHRND